MTYDASTVLRRVLFGAVGWFAVLTMLAVAALAPSASVRAASVTPIFISETSSQTCTELAVAHGGGQVWLANNDAKSDPNGDGTLVVTGFGTITISNSQNDKTFNWSSTFGIDAVYVKAGSGGSNLYVYAPTAGATESTGDTGLTSPGEQGNGISHITFCFDAINPAASSAPPATGTPGVTVTATPTPTVVATPTPTPAVVATPTASVAGVTATPVVTATPSSTGGVGGATATPAPATTLPPTDGIAGQAGSANDSWRVVLIGLAAVLASVLVLLPAAAARRK